MEHWYNISDGGGVENFRGTLCVQHISYIDWRGILQQTALATARTGFWIGQLFQLTESAAFPLGHVLTVDRQLDLPAKKLPAVASD